MSLLLTGATGFLGRNVLLRALSDGREIFAAVRSADKLGQQLQFEKQTDRGVRVLSAVPGQWPKITPEYAILGGGVLFERTRSDYFCTNVDWTLATLRALPKQCRTVVISSQSAGGPTPAGKASRTEADSDAPITWYGESKLAMEESIRREFPNRPITILRPPMILGPRDSATLPLFRMARSRVRIKPGLRSKTYSFIAVDDSFGHFPGSRERTSRAKLLCGFHAHDDRLAIDRLRRDGLQCEGHDLPVPQALVRILSRVVDASPALRAQTPSLTRDRAREIWPDRWVVDGSKFEQLTGWRAKTGLADALRTAHNYYVEEGKTIGQLREKVPAYPGHENPLDHHCSVLIGAGLTVWLYRQFLRSASLPLKPRTIEQVLIALGPSVERRLRPAFDRADVTGLRAMLRCLLSKSRTAAGALCVQ